MSSGFCVDVSVALPSAAESAEVAVSAGVLAATYIRELVDRKEHDPGDDLISRLATDYVATGQLNRETAAITDAVMMQAGHETTANMIALGPFHCCRIAMCSSGWDKPTTSPSSRSWRKS